MDTPVSRFLPDGFDGTRPIGLIAGRGRYPALVAERIREAGCPVALIAFQGETEPDLEAAFSVRRRRRIKVGQLGKLLRSLKELDCAHALMAGQVTPRRLFHGLHPDLKALRILNRLETRNAETIFGAIAAEIEALGIGMLDARAFLDEHLPVPGMMTSGGPSVERAHIRHGIHIAKGIADLDVGQSVVVRKGTVLAAEAYEGTDAMIERAGQFKTDGLILVKTVKRRQDYRFDVPVFGPRTLDRMHAAGVGTAALEADRVILLDRDALLRRAEELGIGLYGFTHGEAGD